MIILDPGELLKYILIIIVVVILLLGLLNYRKFTSKETEVEPVFYNQQNLEIKNHEQQKIDLWTRVKYWSQPRNLLNRFADLRLNVPITYLKQQIPLLRFYSPESIRKPGSSLYEKQTKNEQGQVVRLTFDLRTEGENDLEDDLSDHSYQIPGEDSKTPDEDSSRKAAEKRNDREPIIALYHSHTSETYYDDVRSNYRGNVPQGEIGNVAQVGQKLADKLAGEYNFQVVHTTEVHDEVYRRSYFNSRQTIKEILEKYPEVDILLDIHRDGVEYGGRETYTTEIKGKKAARIMIIVTNGQFDFAHLDLSDRRHVEWGRNLEFARELAAEMEKLYPGLLLDVRVRDTTYNQDLHPQALLLEIGDYQNSTEEALFSAELLADVIGRMY